MAIFTIFIHITDLTLTKLLITNTTKRLFIQITAVALAIILGAAEAAAIFYISYFIHISSTSMSNTQDF